MREIVHIQAGQCGNQIGAKVGALLRGDGRGGGTLTGRPLGYLGTRAWRGPRWT